MVNFMEISGLSDTERMLRGMLPDQQLNDDPVLAARGGDLPRLYTPLLQDAQVISSLQQRVSASLERPLLVEATGDGAVVRHIAEQVRRMLYADGMLQAQRQLLMSSLLYGYAVAEILWAVNSRHYEIVGLKVRKSHRFVFTPKGEVALRREGSLTVDQLPQEKMVILRSGALDADSPYGRGLGYNLYWPVHFKRLAQKWWARLGENHGVPSLILNYPANASQEQKARAFAALDAVMNNSRIALPESMKAHLVEARSKGEPLQEQIAYYDRLISKIILTETMTSDEGSSRAQAEVHDKRLEILCREDSRQLDAVLQKQLVSRYVAANWPQAEEPKVRRDWSEAEDKTARATRDKILAEMGIHLRDDDLARIYGSEYERRVR